MKKAFCVLKIKKQSVSYLGHWFPDTRREVGPSFLMGRGHQQDLCDAYKGQAPNDSAGFIPRPLVKVGV